MTGGIMRRDFLKCAGALGIVCLSGSALDGTAFFSGTTVQQAEYERPANDWGIRYVKACVVGTGNFGWRLAELLVPGGRGTFLTLGRTESEVWPGPGDWPKLVIRRCHQKYDDLAAALGEYHLVLLFGSPEDPSFCLTREIALRSDSEFIMTITENSRTELRTSMQAAKKEAILLLDKPIELENVRQIVQSVYSFFAGPSLIAVDFSDVRDCCGGRFLKALLFESAQRGDTDALAAFLTHYTAEIQDSQWLWGALSYKNPWDVSMQDWETPTTMIGEVAPDHPWYLFGMDTLTPPKLDFRMSIFCVMKV